MFPQTKRRRIEKKTTSQSKSVASNLHPTLSNTVIENCESQKQKVEEKWWVSLIRNAPDSNKKAERKLCKWLKKRQDMLDKCKIPSIKLNSLEGAVLHQSPIRTDKKEAITQDADGMRMCRYCDYKTVLQNTMSMHFRSKHPLLSGLNNKHCCLICNKSYSLRTALNNHMRRHHLNIYKSCPFCKDVFKLNSVYSHITNQHIPVQFLCQDMSGYKQGRSLYEEITAWKKVQIVNEKVGPEPDSLIEKSARI